MNWVYMTAGGGRWHLDPKCEWLARGQQDATDRGISTHPIQKVSMAGVGERTACKSCATEYATQVRIDVASLRPDNATETASEQLFLDRVLSMPELASWEKQVQPHITIAGRTYRPDFVLTRGRSRIAIEIDVQGPTAETHENWNTRQNALSSSGYEVLRFRTAKSIVTLKAAVATY